MTTRLIHLAGDLAMPVDAVARTFAVLGQRGTGKTSTAVVMAEEMAAAGGQITVVDPTGAWWGLASSADGKGPGVPVVIFGGHHGDVPLEETAGSLVADLIVRDGYSVVLDLELLRKGAQIRFMADFTEALYHSNREALHLFVDEADRFAPQTLRGNDVAAARALGGLEDIVKLGRRKGLGCTLITQRPATLNKNVLEQAETLMAHRLIGPRDRKAIGEWFEAQGDVGAEREAIASISKLARGQTYVFSPAFLQMFARVAIRPKRTYDSSATPEVGAKRTRDPVARADVDLGGLRDRMAETIERAKADDPRELRRRVSELEAALASRPDPAPIEVPVLTDDAQAALERAAAAVDEAQRLMVNAVASAAGELGDIVERIGGSKLPTPTEQPRRPRRGVQLDRDTQPPDSDAGDVAEAPLKAGMRRILEILTRYHPAPLTRQQLSTLAVVGKGGTLSDYLSVLRGRALISEGPDGISPTQTALHEVPAERRQLGPLPPAEIVSLHSHRLKAGQRRILDVLMRAYPDGFTRGELSGLADIAKGGTLSDYLSALRSRGLIEEHNRRVHASSTLYLSEQTPTRVP